MAASERPNPDQLRRVFTIAGRPVQLRVAGDELSEALLTPFAHLPCASDNGTPALTIVAVDQTKFEVPPPNPHPNGPAWSFDGHHVSASPDGRFVTHRVLESGSVWTLDRMTKRVLAIANGADRLSLYERGKAAQILLPFWLETQGLDLIHSALISWKGRGVLIGGPNGAGKSTTALACLSSGFDYLGDDYIVIERGPDGVIQGHSVYGCAFLEPAHLARFPALVPHAIAGPYASEVKRLLLLNRAYPSQMPASAKLEFLLLPRIGARSTELRKATKAEALRQFAPSSLLMLARPEPAGMAKMAQVVQQVQCFWLDLGPDLDAIPREISRLLEMA